MQNPSNKNPKIQNCFYICGLTGGPFFPIPAIMEQVESKILNAKPILIGVKNSYESKLSQEVGYNIEYLPKAKLDLLSFKNQGCLEIIQGIFQSIWSVLLLVYSFVKCLFLLIKYNPILIYSTGSFLAVPMLWAAKLTNVLKITKAKIVLHQQDATLGLANKLTANLADLKSCVFQYTKDKYPQFQNAELIPNLIITSKYNANNSWQDKDLESFVKDKNTNKPLLLIFGGGSGALAINNWVYVNLNELTNQFRIIHLTGILQKQILKYEKVVGSNSPREGWQPQVDGVFQGDNVNNKLPLAKWLAAQADWGLNGEEINSNDINPNYHTQPSVLQDMPALLASTNLVICRAGLGSISELSLLNKQTFLVPLPNSHQEQNAQLISQTNPNFKILDQEDQNSWINTIQNTKFELTNKPFNQEDLNKYYDKLIKQIQNTV
jgi:UDP-N-acetylglucosamine:LPS N-acetylglucosamine transferase